MATLKPYPLDVQIRAAGEAGFEGVELWLSKVTEYMEAGTFSDVIRLLNSYDLKVAGASGPCVRAHLWYSQADFRKELRENERILDLARKINAETVLLLGSNLDGHSIEQAEDVAYERIRAVVKIAEERNMKLGLEIIGSWRYLNNIDSVVKIVEAIDSNCLGITFDTYHLHLGGDKIENIKKIPREKLFMVHVGDAPDKAVDELDELKDRVYCGQGVISIRKIMAEIRNLGYDGYVSVELYNEEYWKKDAFEVAENSLRTLKETINL